MAVAGSSGHRSRHGIKSVDVGWCLTARS